MEITLVNLFCRYPIQRRFNIKIFITGGNGFLGKTLIRYLRKNDNVIVAPDSKELDLRNHRFLQGFTHERFDVIFHLAAWTQAGNFASKYPGSQWINNQLINTNVLTWWKESQPHAFLVSIGTSCSYEDGSDFDEGSYLKGLPDGDLLTYGSSKRMLYIGQMAIEKEFGLKSLVAVPATLYGEGYELNNRQPHFIFDLIKKSLNQKHHSQPIRIWGNGNQKREIIFVEDFVKILIHLVKNQTTGLINIGSGYEHDINFYLNEILNICDIKNPIIHHDLQAYVGVLSKKLSINRVKTLLPDTRLTNLKVGLTKTIYDLETRYYL